jgi:uncharacterized oligopeptide transporter (OPT) family protein
MKTKAISSIFVLFAIAVGMVSMAPTAFAHPNHAEVSIIAFDESTISSYIADIEHDNPVFKEIVKAGLTPMISTLSLMENAESESEVLGLGLSVIALNIGMYIGLPAFGIVKVIQSRKN